MCQKTLQLYRRGNREINLKPTDKTVSSIQLVKLVSCHVDYSLKKGLSPTNVHFIIENRARLLEFQLLEKMLTGSLKMAQDLYCCSDV